ncbi:uncharacterized protein BXIN_2678 [Babesia sp. Xinjiang]|uniref:uncharacterized protein n=1 Tax=Babesia sp. Xinjiang TaxID=462227 RepID=UPI000A21679B|nr:uncharacterized protein BXIN_2642 [Babesia sp. Xinjiang]XP_028872109.1 uncharacterized protein BXIN_2678 [Babesia sp. Xinjiang]ORM41607.1 hypothetical protein BXIN_2642 [Babesia sp. Xinjiang]ORM41653.1 hypothetical protein BXIN_2678 [Babesia sp. Xinjiang]
MCELSALMCAILSELHVAVDNTKDRDTKKSALKNKDLKYRKGVKSKRDVLQGLQEEARELLSLTYELKMDPEEMGHDDNDDDCIAPKTLLESPQLDIDSKTKQAIERKWSQDKNYKDYKLLPGPDVTKGCETEKVLDVSTSDEARERIVGNVTSTDVILPIRHLQKDLSYPLDISLRDAQSSGHLVADAKREDYQEMLVSLQHKYSVVLRMFEEINEQRMSYIEGIQELQGHLDNARSVMQLQKAEISRLKSNSEYHESVAREAAKEAEHCTAVLTEHVQHEEQLENELEEKTIYIQQVETELVEQRESVKALTERIRELGFMPKLSDNKEFKDAEYTYSQAIETLWNIMTKLSAPKISEAELESFVSPETASTAPLRYLETLLKMPLTTQLVDIYRYRFDMERRFNSDVKRIREDKDKELERNNERAKQLIDTYAARTLQANAENMAVRAFLQTSLHRCTLRRNGEVVARIEKDIYKIDFGFHSSSYILHHELIKEQDIYPWHFFSITTRTREYNMVCRNDKFLDVLIIGINLKIMPKRFSVGIVGISQMRLLRAKTKLHYHCMVHNISYHRMWINAIKKTVAEQQTSH